MSDSTMDSRSKNCFSLKALHYETLLPVRLDIENDLIAAVVPLAAQEAASTLSIVAPGLIDNQVNGYAGIDFSGDKLSPMDIITATVGLWKTGVTTYLPTLVTNTIPNLIQNLGILKASLSYPEVSQSVPGFHLEGPWLSKLEGFRGCHREDQLILPDIRLMRELQQAAGGAIRQVTLAPELPGAIELLDYCNQNQILTSIGHSNANRDEIVMACDHGAVLSTHLGNGCANMIHRHNNPIWPQLAESRIVPTVIADGHHLTHEELVVFLKVKGCDHLILTSDITYLAGMPAGRYLFAGSEVILTEDGRLRSAVQEVLAGASLPLLRGVENMIRFTDCSLGEAINMASQNVAKLFGWQDRGALLPGRRADLVLLTKQNGSLKIEQTIVGGAVVYQAD